MRKLADVERERALKDDDSGEPPAPPHGAKNYITAAGYARLKNELQHLLDRERPELVKTIAWAASNGDRSENADYIYGKRRLREIDRRIRFLNKRLEIAAVIDPARAGVEQVFFRRHRHLPRRQRRRAHRQHRRAGRGRPGARPH